MIVKDFLVWTFVLSGEGGIQDQFCNILTPFYMCLIPQIIHIYNKISGWFICFLSSQSSHTILSVPHRCNFFRAKMHQNLPYLCLYNLLKTNKIIIIYLKHPFSLECFFSISHFLYLVSSISLDTLLKELILGTNDIL